MYVASPSAIFSFILFISFPPPLPPRLPHAPRAARGRAGHEAEGVVRPRVGVERVQGAYSRSGSQGGAHLPLPINGTLPSNVLTFKPALTLQNHDKGASRTHRASLFTVQQDPPTGGEGMVYGIDGVHDLVVGMQC